MGMTFLPPIILSTVYFWNSRMFQYEFQNDIKFWCFKQVFQNYMKISMRSKVGLNIKYIIIQCFVHLKINLLTILLQLKENKYNKENCSPFFIHL